MKVFSDSEYLPANLYCIFVSFHLDNLAFFQKSYYAYYSADKTDEGY